MGRFSSVHLDCGPDDCLTALARLALASLDKALKSPRIAVFVHLAFGQDSMPPWLEFGTSPGWPVLSAAWVLVRRLARSVAFRTALGNLGLVPCLDRRGRMIPWPALEPKVLKVPGSCPGRK